MVWGLLAVARLSVRVVESGHSVWGGQLVCVVDICCCLHACASHMIARWWGVRVEAPGGPGWGGGGCKLLLVDMFTTW
jgi:hypothetical protein